MQLSEGALKLYEFLPEKCWMTERNLAKKLRCRAAKIASYKDELEAAGYIHILLQQKGRRSNPTHEIIKHKNPRRSPICKHISGGFCLGEWGGLGRNELVECYLKSNWCVVPFAERSKQPLAQLSLREWARRSASEKMDFFYDHPNLNVGLVVCSHMTVVDVDSKTNHWIQHENFGCTLTVSTPGGFHFYFRKDPVVTTSAKTVPEIDTRCGGSFVLLPGSIHPSGAAYAWETITTPRPLPIEFRREWRQRDFNARRRAGNFTLPPIIPQGTRNDTLWRYGRSLRAKGKNYFEIEAELSRLNRDSCLPPLPAAELDRLLKNVDGRADEPDFRRARTNRPAPRSH